MKAVYEAQLVDGQVQPKHEIEIVCAACGYDLDEAELDRRHLLRLRELP